MQRENLLIEVGVEEIPAGYIKPALDSLSASLNKSLEKTGLKYSKMHKYSSPRRFAIQITDLQLRQEDIVIERIGPTVKMSYNEKGYLTKAALGFLRGAKADEKDIYQVETNKGEKIAVKLEKKGKSVIELIPEILRNALENINFPKTMRWGNSKLWFARPVRWLIILLGKELIPFEYNGLKIGKISFGNRYPRLVNPVEVKEVNDYIENLKTVKVFADREERKSIIEKQLKLIEQERDCTVIPVAGLLETVTDLVEYPTAVAGKFEKKYLRIPEKIIISTLSNNQKCFALREKSGKLSNQFIFINNGNPEYQEIIRHGNEKVIGARLADAEFYYQEDTKKSFDNYVNKLDQVLFQKDLGNLYEKTERIIKLSEYICEYLNIDGVRKENILRCAQLSKADLITLMLGEKEFTKLQGYIGMKYALASGENSSVATGIYEHYQPRGQNDELPEQETGIIVSLADKLDTVCGIMGIGMLPTGSNDPYALRRAANGIVSILAEKGIELNLEEAIKASYKLLSDKLPAINNNLEKVIEFFSQRINWLLKLKGIGYDVIESVMHIDKTNIPDLLARATELEKFRKKEEFISLVLGFKRVSNIISAVENFSDVNPKLLQEQAEKQLFAEYRKLSLKLDELGRNYQEMMEHLVAFSSYINHFFDAVLVNVENLELRSNRYNLLKGIREEFLRVADLALIVVEEKNKKGI